MKTLLLTGAGGFIGSHLLECIQKEHYDINVILVTSKNIPGYRCVNTVCYEGLNDALMMGERVDYVLHLAGFSPKNSEDSNNTEKNYSNISYTINLLNSLPNVPEKIVYCSTISVYNNFSVGTISTNQMINENTFVNPTNAYGVSKYCSELVIKKWCLDHNSRCCILRLAPVYGEGDLREQFIYTMMHQVSQGKELNVTAPSLVRNLLYVNDCCQFILKAIDERVDASVINVVSSTNTTILEIAKIISSFGNTHYTIVKPLNGFSSGVNMMFDSALRQSQLGEERTTLYEGLWRVYGNIKKFQQSNS